MANKLTDAVLELAAAINGSAVDDALKQSIEKMVWNNELDEDDSVPQWLIDLLGSMTRGEVTEWTAFSDEGYSYSDVFELMAELEDVLALSYEHREESIALTVDALGIEAVIWVELSQYRVVKL